MPENNNDKFAIGQLWQRNGQRYRITCDTDEILYKSELVAGFKHIQSKGS